MASSLTSPVTIDGLDIMSGMLIPGAAKRHIVTRSTATDENYKYWSQNAESGYHHTTIQAGHDACTSGRNDIVLLSPDSHSQAASLTWTKNMTHLIGAYGPAVMNQRARIGHSVTVDPLMTVSGYGCTFSNIYTMYGAANTDLNCWIDSGGRNSYVNAMIGAPNAAAACDGATFCVLNLSGEGEYYFKNSSFGNDNVAWTNGDLIRVDTPCSPKLVFEDCLFLMTPDNGQVCYLDFGVGAGTGFIIFKNCIFMNRGTANTVAIGTTGIAASTVIYCVNTAFINSTDIIAAAHEAKVVFPNVGGAVAVADELIGLTTAFDHTV